MASLPSYDPNVLASHDFSAVLDEFDRLEADEDEPLLNRAIQTTLPPGSTFKIVTAAAAIENGDYEASDDVPGGVSYQLPQTSDDTGLIDNEGRACGVDTIPFKQAMANSCNTTFAQLGVQLGAEKLKEQAEAFGFNQHYLDDLGAAGDLEVPRGRQRAAGRPVRHRPVRRAGHAAADGDGRRRDRQPGHRDAALHRRRGPVADVRGAAADRARGAVRRPSRPRPPTS